jgi:hypothetical protein
LEGHSPLDKIINVFSRMHANEMLFEVVKARPQLGGFGATWGETLVHARLANVFTVHGLFVAIKIVDGSKANRATRTILLDTAVLTGVACVVFPGMKG